MEKIFKFSYTMAEQIFTYNMLSTDSLIITKFVLYS